MPVQRLASVTGGGPAVRSAAPPALLAAGLALLLLWVAPPGADLAAHVYQRSLFLEHGLSPWNNLWYAGRYSFVTYSLLYYPLAAVLGIRALAVVVIAASVLAWSAVASGEWGRQARASRWGLAAVWPGMVLSAAFPFALGAALALLALWALQARRRWRFAALAALCAAASPLAFLLLALVLAGVGAARVRLPGGLRGLVVPAAVVALLAGLEIVLWRAFPGQGRYPFSPAEAAAAITFCLLGLVVTRGVPRARPLAWFLGIYLAAVVAGYLVPSGVGENIARLRFAALPLALLAVALRRWRPLPLCLVCLGLAAAWNVSPLAASWAHASADPSARRAYWAPAVAYLRAHLGSSYRVEVVDTVGHWGAVYLPERGIPIARGWFRQDDFPQNSVLYGRLGPRAYLAWLRGLGVRYVVLTAAPLDYSARAEAALVLSGRSGLHGAFVTPDLRILEVPGARPIATGPAGARVVALDAAKVVLSLAAAGTYRVAVRWSPYWLPSAGCAAAGADGMVRLHVARPARVVLRFRVAPARAMAVIAGDADARGPGCPRR